MFIMLGCIHKNLIYTIEFTYLRRKFSFVINIIFFTVLSNYSANHDSHVVQCPYWGRNLTNLYKSYKY